jgi:predicted DNA-binding transcriptional regulator AlpA
MDATAPTLLIDADELAAALGVSPVHVWRLKAAGRLPEPVRLGRRTLWPRGEIEAWVAARCPDRRAWEARKRAKR